MPPSGGHPPVPPVAKPFYRRAWFIVLASLLGLGIVSNAVGDNTHRPYPTAADDSPELEPAPAPADVPPPQAPEGERAPRIGEPAADGDFQFVVNGVQCGETSLGSASFGATAQGQFCIVDLTTTNIGDEMQTFFGGNVTLLNGEGQEFSSDAGAALHLDDSSSLYEEVNPGNTLNSKVVFDVPSGMTPTAIELHDSAFSGGVTVLLQ